jgi:uncharacterized protein YbaR (Trm112 family)/SAM-dependent methyltransferase
MKIYNSGVNVNKKLFFDLIVCPCCGSHLSESANNGLKCINKSCLNIYPIINGIPVLINEKLSIFKISDYKIEKNTYFKHSSSRLKFIEKIKKYIPSISHNLAAKSNIQIYEKLLFQNTISPKILVIGGGIVGEGMASLLNNNDAIIVESDIAFAPRTSIIADSHCLPFKDGVFDGVICQAVLEHVISPSQCANEIERVLRVGGVIYAETPFMQQVHGGDYDFTRFTLNGHRNLFLGFDEMGAGITGGAAMAFSWSWVYLLQSFAIGKKSRIFLKMIGILSIFPVKYLDYIIVRNKYSFEAASGFYFLGIKK